MRQPNKPQKTNSYLPFGIISLCKLPNKIMKNFAFVLTLFFLCSALHAQVAKLPRLTVQDGLLDNRYLLAEKQQTKKQIRLHLEKSDAQAYHFWRAADRADAAGWVWGALFLGGTAVAVVSDEASTRLIGSGVGVLGAGGLLVCTINSASKRKKAVKHYNSTAGY